MRGRQPLTAGEAIADISAPAGARRRSRGLVLTVLVVAGVLLPTSGASAAEGITHTLAGQIKPQGVCTFEEPTITAVNDDSGEVYVYNRGDNYLDRFGPAAGSTPTDPKYQCLGRQRAGKSTFGEEGNEGLAVDNSPTSPARGTVYLVAPEEHDIIKFKSTGGAFKSAGHIKRFKQKVGEELYEQEEFEPIDGLAVDGQGRLWVDEGELIFSFTPETSKLLSLPLEVFGNCSPRPGFAVSPDGRFLYVARERENREEGCEEATAVMTVSTATGEPLGEPRYKYQFEREPNSGVTVDPLTGDVYYGNVTNISVFAGELAAEGVSHTYASGTFLERFGSLEHDAGVAVDSATGEVFATDAQGDQLEAGEGVIDVYARVPEHAPAGEPTLELPDGRRAELVTPVNKYGSLLKPPEFGAGLIRAAADGDAITYTSSGPIVEDAPSSRAPEPTVDLSRREGGGWRTQDLGTPRSSAPVGYQAAKGTEYKSFSEDLSTAVVEPALGVFEPHESRLSPGATETTDYLRDIGPSSGTCEPVPSSCYRALVSPLDDLTSTPFGDRFEFAYATPDARHVVLRSSVALNEEGPVGVGGALYEWEAATPPHEGAEAGGILHRVSIAPPGEESAASVPVLGESLSAGTPASMRHAVSDDGSHAFWAGAELQLYMRDIPSGETLRIDTPEAGQEPSEPRAVFRIANAEGTRAFFTDGSRLTADSTSHEDFNSEETQESRDEDLYLCEVGEVSGKDACAGGLKNLTATVGSTDESASVQGVVGASEDGDTVYFVADGDLAPGGGTGHCGASESGAESAEEASGRGGVLTCNLYVEHRGASGWEPPRFVTRLTQRDSHDWLTTLPGEGITARVSPDGNYVAFMSAENLTGYDNSDAATGAPDEEVYLYDLATDRLVCASCKPTGDGRRGCSRTRARCTPRSTATRSGANIGSPPTSARGRRTTPTPAPICRAASPTAVASFSTPSTRSCPRRRRQGGRLRVRAAHVGTCASESGCIGLISAGNSAQESVFIEASEGGEDAFILTTSRLAPQDADSAYDVYDAHVCGEASPCTGAPPEVQRSACEATPEEATCRAPSATAPALPGVTPSTQPGTEIMVCCTNSQNVSRR